MFKVYDSNFKEVKIPVDRLGFGSRALEINIGPVIYENVYSQSRRADTLVKRYAKDRQVSIVLMVSGMNETDFRMKRDALYSFFRNLGIFFVAEEQQPFKLIKVIVNDDYDIDRQTPEIAMPEIPLKIIDTPFKQSLHTTADLDAEGIRWNNKWAYGMGLSSDAEQWKYSYEYETKMQKLSASDFEQGTISSSNGQNSSNANNIRTIDYFDVVRGQTYTFADLFNSSKVNYWWLFEYDSEGNYIGFSYTPVGGNSQATFTARGERVRVRSHVHSGETLSPSEVGTSVQPVMVRGTLKTHHNIVFFNAGTEEVKLIRQKESEVTVNIKSSANRVEIYDGQTTFRLNKVVKSGDILRMRGHTITLNGNNVLGDTNGNFLTAKKGWNNWEIRGLNDFEFNIDFRFLYD